MRRPAPWRRWWPWALVGLACVLVAFRDRDGTAMAAEAAAVVNPTALGRAMLDEGFPAEVAMKFANVRTELITSEPGHYRFRQTMPGVPTTRDVEILVTESSIGFAAGTELLPTSRGFSVHPQQLEVQPIGGGYVLRSAFYIPPGELSAEEIAALAPRRLPSTRTSWKLRLIPVAYAETPPGIAVQAAVAVSNAGSGSTGTFIRPLPAGSAPPATPGQSFWDNIHWSDDHYIRDYEAVAQELNDTSFSRRGQAWQENELRLARERRAAARPNTLVAAGFAAWELYNALRDWWNADEELTELERCAANPTARTTQRARSEDPNYARAAGERLAEARSELRVNNGIRGANTITNFAAARIPGPLGAAAAALSSGNDAMLAGVHEGIMRDVGRGIVRCGAQYVAAEVSYSYSESQRDPTPEHPSWSSLTEVLNGKLIFGVDGGAGRVEEGSGWGSYRWADRGGYYCDTYSLSVEGALAMYIRGDVTGSAIVETAPGRSERFGTFDLSLEAAGAGLTNVNHGGVGNAHEPGVHAGTPWGYRCKPYAGSADRNGTGEVHCNFKDVPVLAGGTFLSDFEQADRSDPDHVIVRSCRLVLKPLAARPRADPTEPPPPPPRGAL